MRVRTMSLVLVLCMCLAFLPGLAQAYETYVCREQGFSFEYDSAYGVEWQDENGAVIYTKVDGSIPYVLLWLSEGSLGDPLRLIKEQDTPDMRQRYGSDLIGTIEYELYEIGGKQLPAALYSYRLQDYVIDMLRAYDSVGGRTLVYTAKYIHGEGQATLGALSRAMNSLELLETADGLVPSSASTSVVSRGSADELQLVAHELCSADGVLLGRSVVPADFNVSVHLSDSMADFSLGNPLRVLITADSADGRSGYVYRSACDFIEYRDTDNAMSGVVQQDGAWDAYSMTTMLSARSAAEYADDLFAQLFPEQELKLLDERKPSAQLQAFEQRRKEELLVQMQELASLTPGISIDGAYWDAVERRYSLSLNGEAYIAVIAVSVGGYQMSAMNYGLLNIGNSCINWGPYETYIFLTPASQYDAARAGFDAFMLNTSVSDQFIRFNRDMSIQLSSARNQGLSMDSASSYSQSSLAETIEPGEDYEDRFTDYILDQSDYTTSGGEHIKLPSSFDYVYEDGNGNVFASNVVPDYGVQILTPNT